jgi:hypothetical protein
MSKKIKCGKVKNLYISIKEEKNFPEIIFFKTKIEKTSKKEENKLDGIDPNEIKPYEKYHFNSWFKGTIINVENDSIIIKLPNELLKYNSMRSKIKIEWGNYKGCIETKEEFIERASKKINVHDGCIFYVIQKGKSLYSFSCIIPI